MYTEEQQRNTIEFLKELAFINKTKALLQALEADDADDNDYDVAEDAEDAAARAEMNAQYRAKFAEDVRPFDTDVAAGQIRILADLERLTYVVVLPWGEGVWAIIPFSHFRSPATDKELLAEEADDAPLLQKVYQVWNMRTLHTRIVQRGWVDGEVSAADRTALSAMAQYHLLGTDLPAELVTRTGVPVSAPSDPRREYIKDAMGLFLELANEELGLIWAEEEVHNA